MTTGIRICILLSSAISVLAADADLILHNGKIVTVDSSFSIQEAIAIQGERIVDIGKSADILKHDRGARTRLIDLHGRTVLPGLIDSHVHALSAGLSEYRAPLPQLHSFADIQQYLREQAAKFPKGNGLWCRAPFPHGCARCACRRKKCSMWFATIRCSSMPATFRLSTATRSR